MSGVGLGGMTGAASPEPASLPARLFNPVTAIWMVLVGVFAFSALVVLSTYAPELRTGDNADSHALSHSAIGFAGAVELLQAAHQTVVISHAKIAPGHSDGLLIATPPALAELGGVKALGFGGPVLVVLPKWDAFPNPFHRGWVTQAKPIDLKAPPKTSLLARVNLARRPGTVSPRLTAKAPPFGQTDAFAAGPVEQLQSIQAADLIPVLTDDTGAVILAREPKASIYYLSDPDLLNNHGLKNLATAVAAGQIIAGLKAADGPVLFDVSLNGFARERSVMRLLFDPPFLAVTLCLFFAACLAGFQAACRFGAVRGAGRVFALGKEALADNTAALIRLTGREHRMGGRYAELTRTIAAKAVGAPRELTGDPLIAFLDRMGAQRGATDRLSEMTAQIAGAGDKERTLAAAKRLFRWRLEMTRERQ